MATETTPEPLAAQPVGPAEEWASLLREFPGVTLPLSMAAPPNHSVEHQVVMSGRPATAKFRRLDPSKLAAAKLEFHCMLDAGIIRRSSSAWSSPLHMVKKKDGGWRPCGDFWRLNVQTSEDKNPLPNMADLSGHLDGCKIFSKLD
jgi:hypothetical protein